MTGDRPLDVLSVGDASVDYFVRVPRIPGRDDKAIGRLLGVRGGGMSANLAAAAAAVGARAGLVTAVGSDQPGRDALDRLAALGVDVSPSVVVAGGQTWFCVIQLDESGEKALVGAVTDVKIPRAEDVPDALLASARMVAPLADDVPWATEIATRAVAHGCTVAIDLEPNAVTAGWSGLTDLLAASSVVFCNRATVDALGAPSVDDCLRRFLDAGADVAVATAGQDGARCLTRTGSWQVRPAATTVVDTTGAGDALAGGFLGALLAGRPPEDALVAGAAVAASCVAHLGSRGYLDVSPPTAPTEYLRQRWEQA